MSEQPVQIPPNARLRVSCSWCHHLNPSDQKTCSHCGHDAHVARCGCTCKKCRRGPMPMTEAADVIRGMVP
jgi:hypothetical protein